MRIAGLLVALAVVAAGCSFNGEAAGDRVVTAYFSRAVQMFPGNSVRVLGVTVGRVIQVENTSDSVRVTFRIDDPDLKLPSNVKATIVPVSLLGERYIQLFPAYQGGPQFTEESIPIARTSVPVEQDELLRSLHDYFGNLDPNKVAAFVSQTSRFLRGNGEKLNRLIGNGTEFVSLLESKKDTLADLITHFNTVTQSLSTRQQTIGKLIREYNVVSRLINENRAAVEGTITGLNRAAVQLASLLTEHRAPLKQDIAALTRTARTLSRNADTFARTGHWARRLFDSASRAVDYERDWLRLGNQGAPLAEAIQARLRDRLVGVCMRLELPSCSSRSFWAGEMPDLFCLTGSCPKGQQQNQGRKKTPGEQLEDTLEKLPPKVREEVNKELVGTGNCRNAAHPKRCRKKADEDPGETLDKLLDDLHDEVDKLPDPLDTDTGGLP